MNKTQTYPFWNISIDETQIYLSEAFKWMLRKNHLKKILYNKFDAFLQTDICLN